MKGKKKLEDKMEYKSMMKKIEKFIQKRTDGLEGCVLGLSGGIDSTFVAYLSVRALGKEKVYGIIMPYGSQSVEDGELVAKKLGINYDIINIKPIVDTACSKSNHFEDKLALGNLMARVRMCMLYGAANKKNMLVMGTTNKSEMEIGYFTKYGDGGVDLEPIANLYKTQVWEFSKKIKNPVKLPKRIIEKKPTAELWEGQTDEKELGFDYYTLDKVLQGKTEGIEEKVLEKIESLRKNSLHKKKMPVQMEVLE